MNIFDLQGDAYAISVCQTENEESLFAKSNVTGVGIGHKIKEGRETGDMCLTVFVTSKIVDPKQLGDDLIPKEVGGFKTDVVETGVLMAGSQLVNKDRIRPAMGGYSVGHFQVTAGTIACCVKDINPAMGVTTRYYILSNNHVLANTNAAAVGDPILQPGRLDGGRNPEDIIARLTRFVPINFAAGTTNLVDCAIAEGDFHDLNREIYWVGHVNGTALPTVGQTLYKTGRTTANTTGKVTSINATVNVNYAGRIARFVNQITTTAMSAGGDSGSLMVNANNQAVGLLFAGSSAITIANPIGPVMSNLGIKFV